MKNTFTGRHMAAILLGFFVVVAGVNVLMARLASTTFGGVVVDNSYVATQNYNRWLKQAEAEKALGWKASVRRLGNGRIEVALAGAPGETVLTLLARHPLGRQPDRNLPMSLAAPGRYLSEQALPKGRWRIRIRAQAGEQAWHSEQDLP